MLKSRKIPDPSYIGKKQIMMQKYQTLRLNSSPHFIMVTLRLNPFLANVPILYPLKTPENQRFSDIFTGYKMGTLARNELMQR